MNLRYFYNCIVLDESLLFSILKTLLSLVGIVKKLFETKHQTQGISTFGGPAERYRQEGDHVPKCLTQSESREIHLGTLSLLSEGKL